VESEESFDFEVGDNIHEVYTGNILVAFEQSAGGSVVNFDCRTFLPTEGPVLRFYPRNMPFKHAVLVALTGITAHEDEEFICSIDSWKLALEPQTFSGATAHCWVLRFTILLLNGHLHRVGYHVFLQRPKAIDVDTTKVPSNSMPA
jgi:hypothetical protein